MNATFLHAIPVLPTADMARDIRWYQEKMGLQVHFSDKMYAVLYRDNLILHLQWHADTVDDPLPGGSVVRILVRNIQPLFEEFVKRGAVEPDKLRTDTPWKTNEFGFFDLNQNAIFILEDAAG